MRPGAKKFPGGWLLFSAFDLWPRRAGAGRSIDSACVPAAAPAAAVSADAASPSPPVAIFFFYLEPFLVLLRRLWVGEDQDHVFL